VNAETAIRFFPGSGNNVIKRSYAVDNLPDMQVLEDIYRVDLRILLWCRKSRYYPLWMTLVRQCSRTGDGYMQVIVPLMAWVLTPAVGAGLISAVCIAFAIERPIYWILKNTLKRRRPPEVVPCFSSVVTASDRFSFPSGHTMSAFLLAVLVYLHLGPAALPMILWAAAVGASRVILGVHFPSDIIAGAGIGTAIAFAIFNYFP
jgi:undecaprenyl-diphosphatase